MPPRQWQITSVGHIHGMSVLAVSSRIVLFNLGKIGIPQRQTVIPGKLNQATLPLELAVK